jgi:hypothetical protein
MGDVGGDDDDDELIMIPAKLTGGIGRRDANRKHFKGEEEQSSQSD